MNMNASLSLSTRLIQRRIFLSVNLDLQWQRRYAREKRNRSKATIVCCLLGHAVSNVEKFGVPVVTNTEEDISNNTILS